MENIRFALNAILPMLFVMLAGALAGRFSHFDRAFFKRVNGVAFRFFLSTNLFYNVYNLESFHSLNARVLLFAIGGCFLCMLIGFICARLCTKDPLKQGPMIQATYRSNNAIIGIPLAAALGGTHVTETSAFTSVCAGCTIPIYAISAVLILDSCVRRASKETKVTPSVAQWCKTLLLNPLVLGCLLGFVCVFIRSLLPEADGVPVFTIKNQIPTLYKAISSVAGAASPVMLFCLGATLDFHAGKALLKEISVGVILKLIICPSIIIGLALLFKNQLRLTVVEMPALVAIFASPTAITSAVVAQESGCDGDLAAHLVVWSSVLSLASMFCVILLLRGIGML